MQITSNCLGIALKIVSNTCSNVYSIKIIFPSLFTRFQKTLKTRSKPLTWFGHTIDLVKTFSTAEMTSKLFPRKQLQVNYFVRLSDIVHCRYALGFEGEGWSDLGPAERVTLTPMDYESMALARPSHNLGPSGHSYDIGDGLLGMYQLLLIIT